MFAHPERSFYPRTVLKSWRHWRIPMTPPEQKYLLLSAIPRKKLIKFEWFLFSVTRYYPQFAGKELQRHQRPPSPPSSLSWYRGEAIVASCENSLGIIFRTSGRISDDSKIPDYWDVGTTASRIASWYESIINILSINFIKCHSITLLSHRSRSLIFEFPQPAKWWLAIFNKILTVLGYELQVSRPIFFKSFEDNQLNRGRAGKEGRITLQDQEELALVAFRMGF